MESYGFGGFFGQWIGRTLLRCRAAFPRCAWPECSAGLTGRWLPAAHGILLQQQWYCSPQCFESAARRCFARAGNSPSPAPPVRHRLPLGLVLLSRGHVSNAQLRSALQAQQESSGKRIGEWLEEMGFASERQITAAVGIQWACPVLPDSAISPQSLRTLLPLPLLENFRMLPVHFTRERVLYVAFSEGVDYTALYTIEQAMDCRTEACLVGRSSMNSALLQLAGEPRAGDFVFERGHDDQEMARITCGCAIKLGAHSVRIVACGDYVWARLETSAQPANLLFRRS